MARAIREAGKGATFAPVTTSRHPWWRNLVVAVVATVAVVSTVAACGTERATLDTSVTLPPAGGPATGELAADLSVVATPNSEGTFVFRDAPREDAAVVTELPNPRPIDADPPVPVPLVLLVADQTDDWVQVYLPIRPNGSTGWIKAADVDLTVHPWRIRAYLDEFRLEVLNAGEVVFTTDIGVARDNAPTPGGLYFTTELLRPPDPDTVYGTYAYGLSGFSETFLEFNGGAGQLGIHGTNEPELIGQAVSAGCIRLRNDDIDYLVETLRVPTGVPVEIITGGQAPGT